MSDMGQPSRLRSLLGTQPGPQRERVLTVFRLGALGALLWGAASELQRGVPGRDPWVAILIAASAAGWTGWVAGRLLGASDRALWACLALMAAAGGALAGWASISVGVLAVAALGAGIGFEPVPAFGVVALGVAMLVALVTGLGTPSPLGVIAEGSLAAAAGLMAGATRRQYTKRAQQAEQLLEERMRADTERDRATALAERNRIGREVHDVLAHSLGALSVQLDAADALLESGDDPDKARQLVRQARRLAAQGLEETREAVHALRDDPVALAEQLSSLAARDGAELTVTGTPRRLEPDAGLALYRAAQEALTNARKHAPGAQVEIRLGFEPTSTVLMVTNGPSLDADGVAGDLKVAGGGFGLRGMRERIELLGGHVVAEPSSPGWTVQVAVPA